MGSVRLTENHFSTEDEALAEITDRGWYGFAADTPDQAGRDVLPIEAGGVGGTELHWHDFDSLTFVVDGTARVVLEDGTVFECGSGARLEAPARTLHTEFGSAGRVVIGFDRDLAELTQPVNKPASQLDRT